MLDDRGYIEVFDADLSLLGYLKSVDYNSCTFELTMNMCEMQRYVNDEMLMYDNSFVCNYCYYEKPIITNVHYCYGF